MSRVRAAPLGALEAREVSRARNWRVGALESREVSCVRAAERALERAT
jgi:hypothetical protein